MPTVSSVPQKRKQPCRSALNTSSTYHRSAKRVKTLNARKILVQTCDKALNKNGDLDVSAFVKAREYEIKAMVASMGASKTSLSTRAFQQVPKDLRRRTASHNVKRVPKRLRARAAKEMKDDNTPTVVSRRRKPTPHQRLRIGKAKELKKLGALTKRKRDESRKQKPGETDPEKMVSIGPRVPRLRKDTLSKPNKPPARFRKRQVHKSWLPTHLFHAKRAHMTRPKEPLWRFAIPLSPTEKCYRTTHRATTSRGCVAWDTSYTATIGIEGVAESLFGLLKSIGVHENILFGKQGVRFRKGTRCWQGWIRQRDGEKRWIAEVGIFWCPEAVPMENSGVDASKTENSNSGIPDQAVEEGEQEATGKVHKQVANRDSNKQKRRLFCRVHPSAFFQVWNELLKVSKIQRPAAMIEDLRFEIGSIEVIGPESTESLMGALRPITARTSPMESSAAANIDDVWVDIETPEIVWPQLAAISNPASLPPNAILGFNVSDPRLQYPPKNIKQPNLETTQDTLLELISSWPPDQTQAIPEIFDRTKRLTASRQLASQKAINRRKGEALPGDNPTPSTRDPKIPILLSALRTSTTAGQGSWTLLLPWDCVLPVWYSLMHYPLTSGGNPRFGGLNEKRQISFEQGIPWYPADYPGTRSGYEWELTEREKKKQEWERRPKGKRTSWESVDLGHGTKGEIGLGWACDWERLFQGPPPPAVDGEAQGTLDQSGKATKEGTSGKGKSIEPLIVAPNKEEPPKELPDPPHGIHHMIAPLAGKAPIPSTALSPIHLTLFTVGHPTRNARIYRLPTRDPELRAKWVALAHPPKASKQRHPSRAASTLPKSAATHQRVQSLAASLLGSTVSSHDAGKKTPRAGDQSYPSVPEEVDLIGFVTTGNYHLGEGRSEAIGNVAVARVMGDEHRQANRNEQNMCIVREAGQSTGRLARWKFI